MSERRSLIEGVKVPAAKLPASLSPEERKFIYPDAPPVSAAHQEARVLVSTRIRADLARALKRASLSRQLEGVTPSTLQDILEEAIEPWLRAHKFLP